MKEKQKSEAEIKQFINELIDQRALTMEDGRARGEIKLPAVEKPVPPSSSADDGDLL